jgi:hypothetical protein
MSSLGAVGRPACRDVAGPGRDRTHTGVAAAASPAKVQLMTSLCAYLADTQNCESMFARFATDGRLDVGSGDAPLLQWVKKRSST